MSNLELATLPPTLQEIRTRPLFVMRLDVKPLVAVGATPGADRRVGIVTGGEFEGERLSGVVLDGGADWQTVHRRRLHHPGRAAGAEDPRRRAVHDALPGPAARPGRRHAAAADAVEPVDPAAYYFRMTPVFETAATRYDFLNRIVAVGTGHRLPGGPVYSVFEVI